MVPLKSKQLLTDDHIEGKEDRHSGVDAFISMDLEEMKRARRRLKNKISAQESRRRKKEYVDALEAKLKQRDQEKNLLKDKVTELEEKIRDLVDELFKVKQDTLQKNTGDVSHSPRHSESDRPKSVTQISRTTQTGVCLLCYFKERSDGEEKMENLATNYNHAMSPCPSEQSIHQAQQTSSPTIHRPDSFNFSADDDKDSMLIDDDEDIDVESNSPHSQKSEPTPKLSYGDVEFRSYPLKRSRSTIDDSRNPHSTSSNFHFSFRSLSRQSSNSMDFNLPKPDDYHSPRISAFSSSKPFQYNTIIPKDFNTPRQNECTSLRSIGSSSSLQNEYGYSGPLELNIPPRRPSSFSTNEHALDVMSYPDDRRPYSQEHSPTEYKFVGNYNNYGYHSP